MIFGESPLKDAWRRAAWGPGREALEALPAPWEAVAVRLLGRAAAAGLRAKRGAIRANLVLAFPARPAADLDRLAADAFAAHFANQYASWSFAKCDGSTWERYLAFHGLERLEAARAEGKGVVLAHPHMGPAQLPLLVLARRGWPMHQVGGGRVTRVALSPTGEWAAATRASLEKRLPVRVHDGKGYLRPVLRALAAGEVVMSAMDATGGGEELGRRLVRTVLDQRMPLPVGPAWMAWRSGAPLLTIACRRNPDRRGPLYLAEVGEPVPVDSTAPRDAAIAGAVDHLAARLDATLRAWPGDWLFWDGFAPGGLIL